MLIKQNTWMIPPITLSLNRKLKATVSTFNFPGIMLDSNMLWTRHTHLVCMKLSKTIGIINRNQYKLIDAPDRLIIPLYSGERSAGTSYSVAAPKLWNSLPANIKSSRSLDTFKKHLRTHYFKEHFYAI